MQYKWLPRLLIISELLNIISKIWTRLLHKSFKFPLRVIHHNVSGAESYFFCYFIIITSWNDFYSLSRFFSRYCQEVFWCLKNDWNLFWIFFFLKNSNIKKKLACWPETTSKIWNVVFHTDIHQTYCSTRRFLYCWIVEQKLNIKHNILPTWDVM